MADVLSSIENLSISAPGSRLGRPKEGNDGLLADYLLEHSAEFRECHRLREKARIQQASP